MAQLYTQKNILPGDFALRINQAYQEREKSEREQRRQTMEDIGNLLRLGGQSYDIYRRYKEFDESSLQKELEELQAERKEITNELLKVHNEIRTLENVYKNNEDYQMDEITYPPEQLNMISSSTAKPYTSFGIEDYTGRF